MVPSVLSILSITVLILFLDGILVVNGAIELSIYGIGQGFRGMGQVIEAAHCHLAHLRSARVARDSVPQSAEGEDLSPPPYDNIVSYLPRVYDMFADVTRMRPVLTAALVVPLVVPDTYQPYQPL